MKKSFKPFLKEVFQFLIGRLAIQMASLVLSPVIWFQFLIGRLAIFLQVRTKDLEHSFNSSQVGSQSVDGTATTLLEYSVSIPHRQARNQSHHAQIPSASSLFQFLIGRLAIWDGDEVRILFLEFQFLIGRLAISVRRKKMVKERVFQFLIGRLAMVTLSCSLRRL